MVWMQNTLLSAVLLLTTYLLMQQQHLQTQLVQLQAQQHNSSTTLSETLQPVTEQVSRVQAGIDKINKTADEANNKILKTTKARSNLVQALADVAQADLLRISNQGEQAADKLKATKKVIWVAGDFFPAQKARLQGLMGAIDKLVASWQKGELETSAVEVRKTLATALGEIGND